MNRTWFACLLVLLFAGALTGQTVDQPSMTCNLTQVMVDEPERPWAAEQKKRRGAYEEQLRRDFKP